MVQATGSSLSRKGTETVPSTSIQNIRSKFIFIVGLRILSFHIFFEVGSVVLFMSWRTELEAD